MSEFDYLVKAKARLLGISVEQMMLAVAEKALMDEEAVDDPLQLVRDINLCDIN